MWSCESRLLLSLVVFQWYILVLFCFVVFFSTDFLSWATVFPFPSSSDVDYFFLLVIKGRLEGPGAGGMPFPQLS